jgi:hypothetical protein
MFFSPLDTRHFPTQKHAKASHRTTTPARLTLIMNDNTTTTEHLSSRDNDANGIAGALVKYSSDGKPCVSTLDAVGTFVRWNGGPVGYRVCWIKPERAKNSLSTVLRLENEVEFM